jgi:hypothetical protein
MAVLAVSMITTPSAAAVTVLLRDGDDATDNNLDIKEVGLTNSGAPDITVYGTPGGMLSGTARDVIFYALNTDDGSYYVTSNFGVEDSTETKNDQKFHAHKLDRVGGDSVDCPCGAQLELFLTEDGNANVTEKDSTSWDKRNVGF